MHDAEKSWIVLAGLTETAVHGNNVLILNVPSADSDVLLLGLIPKH